MTGPSLRTRLLRGLGGLCLGWVWAAFVELGWVGLASAGYGSLDRALEELKSERWFLLAMSAFFTSSLAAWIGAVVGPAAIGVASRTARPILLGSLAGAILSGINGGLLGMLCGAWFGPKPEPASDWLFFPVILGLAVPAGVLGGWLAAMLLTRPSPSK